MGQQESKDLSPTTAGNLILSTPHELEKDPELQKGAPAS